MYLMVSFFAMLKAYLDSGQMFVPTAMIATNVFGDHGLDHPINAFGRVTLGCIDRRCPVLYHELCL